MTELKSEVREPKRLLTPPMGGLNAKAVAGVIEIALRHAYEWAEPGANEDQYVKDMAEGLNIDVRDLAVEFDGRGFSFAWSPDPQSQVRVLVMVGWLTEDGVSVECLTTWPEFCGRPIPAAKRVMEMSDAVKVSVMVHEALVFDLATVLGKNAPEDFEIWIDACEILAEKARGRNAVMRMAVTEYEKAKERGANLNATVKEG